MGRYYCGDIEGKFWFAVQSSNDADFFGVDGILPTEEINYYFDEEHLEGVEKGITVCKKELGEFKEKLDKFFDEHNGYSDDDLNKYLGTDNKPLLVWYARLILGEKILKCLNENKCCSFTAEC